MRLDPRRALWCVAAPHGACAVRPAGDRKAAAAMADEFMDMEMLEPDMGVDIHSLFQVGATSAVVLRSATAACMPMRSPPQGPGAKRAQPRSGLEWRGPGAGHPVWFRRGMGRAVTGRGASERRACVPMPLCMPACAQHGRASSPARSRAPTPVSTTGRPHTWLPLPRAQHYSRLYFQDQLGAASVEWSSKRMTLCVIQKVDSALTARGARHCAAQQKPRPPCTARRHGPSGCVQPAFPAALARHARRPP